MAAKKYGSWQSQDRAERRAEAARKRAARVRRQRAHEERQRLAGLTPPQLRAEVRRRQTARSPARTLSRRDQQAHVDLAFQLAKLSPQDVQGLMLDAAAVRKIEKRRRKTRRASD